jgi:hypothetical protein
MPVTPVTPEPIEEVPSDTGGVVGDPDAGSESVTGDPEVGQLDPEMESIAEPPEGGR